MLAIIQKADKSQISEMTAWPVWTKEVSTFNWEYTETEEAYIVQGQVRISNLDRTESVEFGAGDYVIFPKGLKVQWEILSPLKKHYQIGDKIL